ncbi:hypothetical protein [uncultured Roseibium sp.]|uniref:hypothetical protein n=1 Tax=uncultured Roseibium sp. TaxID=1936171 RepID=UPI0032169694
MKLANLAECSDVSTNTPIGHLLRGKQERINAAKMHAGQVRLFELTEVPDVGSWALENPNKIEKLLKLRSSRSGTSFRNWFHAEAIKENPDIAKSYIELLSETNAFNSTPMRVVRFLCTAAWAAIEPISGTAATIADNFLMGKSEAWRRQNSSLRT